ncbi:hypothetical protein NA57DRAFT_53500 [Rhizodiscina lignyota]|uniref:Uncharacterized protein n=1 Tax=Rhizodiscina lignyota TaxID=1504668 RepID=A0A9P4ILM6_9PEZI|nr:hypothetical protein NA57DRAFT_53500 [Rhizodiscina lignyota]
MVYPQIFATGPDPASPSKGIAWVGVVSNWSTPIEGSTYTGTYTGTPSGTITVSYDKGRHDSTTFVLNVATYTTGLSSIAQGIKFTFPPPVAAAAATTSASINTSGSARTSSIITTSPAAPTTTTPTPTTSSPSPSSSSSSSGSSIPSTSSSASPTRATISPNPIPHNGNPVSGGAAAGIAIGCLAAGAILASLLFFLFCLPKARKRRDYERAPLEMNNVPPMNGAKGGATTTTTSSGLEGAAAIVENHLPQTVPDRTIADGLSSLKTSISNHVLSYYHIAPSQEKTSALNLATVLGNNTPVSVDKLSGMMMSTRTRPAAMRFTLAWIIISRLGLDGDPAATFLPWQFLSCVQSMSKPGGDDAVRAAFLSKWRTITAYLSSQNFGQNNITDNDPRNEHIGKAVADADSILQPYANPREDNAQRQRNLEEIMKRAVRFAYTLFAHPSSFKFDWQANADSLVVFPGMQQVTDEAGAPLHPTRSFGEKEVARV